MIAEFNKHYVMPSLLRQTSPSATQMGWRLTPLLLSVLIITYWPGLSLALL